MKTVWWGTIFYARSPYFRSTQYYFLIYFTTMSESQDYAKSHGRMINEQHIQDTMPAFSWKERYPQKTSVT